MQVLKRTGCDKKDPLGRHPCFGAVPPGQWGRLHLAVAKRCTIKCAYCDRRYDCVNESRPGVASRVLTVQEALERADQVLKNNPAIQVAGIAGPGDALANEETFELLYALRKKYPSLILCAATNGLLLPHLAGRLYSCGLDTLTVTINAAKAATALRIYKDP